MNYWQPGQKLQAGKFTIEGILGGGGFGVTYRAKDIVSGKLVAIKTLNPIIQAQPDFAKHQERFVQEAFRLARCHHPHIIPIYDVCKEGNLWCMVMEYIQGGNLGEYVEDRGVLSETEALGYIQQIGEALSYIHQQGFLHRDVKPANIMLRQNTKTAVLIDFGLAREFVSGKTQTHTSAVTESFAPIEQYERRTKRGAYTDVYALAATYYYLVTRQLPFPSHYRQQGIKLIPPQKHNPQISDRVNQMILEGMALEPYQRPQSIKEWLELLQPNQALSSPPPPQAKPQIQPPQPSVSSPQASSNRVISQPSPATPNNYSSGGKLYQLRDLLAANQWQQADFLTYQIMLKIAAREDKGWLDKESIQKFPCEYLSIIDQLWLKYSQKRFGFSIQQKIWQQGRSKISYLAECHLGDRVGWRVNGQWLDYKNLSFQQNAPIGHLPTCSLGRWVWSWTWSGQCSAFFFLIESCQL